MNDKKNRAVIVGGARTPFVKAFGDFIEMDTIALGVAAVRGLLERVGLPYREVQSLVWGGVILPGTAPNVGREIVLDLKLDPACEAFTVTRACASGLQAVTLAAAAIERGEADVVVAGGSDSTSNAEVKLPQKLIHAAGAGRIRQGHARGLPGHDLEARAVHATCCPGSRRSPSAAPAR